MSQLLNTKLDKETLVTCVQMIESGANPEALAVRILLGGREVRVLQRGQEVVKELRRETQALQAEERESARPGSSAGAR